MKRILARMWVLAGATLGLGFSLPAQAAREPVLGQIDLPHPYYYREMYLPQLTSGPSSLAWSPDSHELIFSMQGSLWRVALDSPTPRQLTAEAAYDYQPDWSHDGKWVVFCRYKNNAAELWTLNISSGEQRVLLANGGVNLEPRFSPDGKRLVFVSTLYNKRFHVFTADYRDGGLANVKRLTGENKSTLPRYYYSPYDHEISPVWSKDGREVLFVSNRGHIYGTGGFWRVDSRGGAEPQAASGTSEPKEIHYEETNWKARPDISPDGSRMVYASYTGRSWHNLWLQPAAGGDAFPIAYGDYDQINARWSPDGARIAFIGNRRGNTEIGLVGVPGGVISFLSFKSRSYLKPMAKLNLRIVDGEADATARVSVTDANGRFYAPNDAWISADDGVDLKQRPFEAHYFHAHGAQVLDVPEGPLEVHILHGFERRFDIKHLSADLTKGTDVTVHLDQDGIQVPDEGHWLSGDVHVHMNYGGIYRNTPTNLVRQAEGEKLSIVNSLLVNKEQRFPDIAYNGVGKDPASTADTLVVHSQEYHTSYWGHLGLLAMSDGVILPGYVGYPNTATSSLMPMNADVADMAHARGGVVGYVHPFDEYPEPIAKPHEPLTTELPVDLALGKVDYMEILGFSDHKSTAQVWYQLLNLGFHLPAAGGTDAMANYASLRGPVGMNRTYVQVPEVKPDMGSWLAGLKAGRTFATNGPLLGFAVGGAAIGDTLRLPSSKSVRFSARLASIVPVEHLDVVCNGKVVKSLLKTPKDSGRFEGEVSAKESGWCVLRAASDAARYPVLDNYVYATTSPVYIEVGGKKAHSPADARYFVAWIDRMIESTSAYSGWNNEHERELTLERLRNARTQYQAMQ